MSEIAALQTATGNRFVPDVQEVFLSRREAASYLHCSANTLARLAMHGEGPPYRIVAGRALYSLAALRRYAGVKLAA